MEYLALQLSSEENFSRIHLITNLTLYFTQHTVTLC